MQNRIARTTFLLLLTAVCSIPAIAQNVLKGKVIDSSENKKLQHSIVALIDLSDTTLYRSWRAGADGGFNISGIPAGKYMLMISYPRMADFLQEFNISDTSKFDLGNIGMISEAKLMQEVVVTAGKAIRMRGDTLEYTADSFAVKPGANVQALLKRLPGIEVARNGQITSQGEKVNKLLVDGDEFFTDDPRFAAQYLKANAVDKVQVYDRKSDEAMLTGFDDGKKTKTINLKLKDDAKNGFFGIAKTGANGEGNYEHELFAGLFNGSMKAGVFGIAAKSQSRDFSSDVMSKTGGLDMEYIEDGTSGMVMKTSQAESLGQYGGSGLPSILNGGAHFSNKWNDKKNGVEGNYQVRSHEGEGWNNSTSFTLVRDTVSFLNKRDNVDRSSGIGHTANGKMKMQLDTFTVMQVRVNGATGSKDIDRSNRSSSENFRNILVNNSETVEDEKRDDKEFKTSISINRKMPKMRGNLNLSLEQEYGNTVSDNKLRTTNNFFDGYTGNLDSTQDLDRLQASRDNYQAYGARLAYTGRFSNNWASQVEYGIKTRISENHFNTLNGGNGKYDEKVDSLSNNYDLKALTQIAGIGANYHTKKYSFGIGSKMFLTNLDQLDLDLNSRRKRSFTNIAPYIRTSLSLGGFSSISLDYSGSTVQPSLEQLQPLRKSSDLLNIQEGNPDLEPGFTHSVSLRYTGGNFKKEFMYMLMASGNLTNNAITNATTITDQNRRISRFVNIDGLPSLTAGLNINKGWRKKGISIGANINYNRSGSYSILNDRQFKSINNSYTVGTNIRYALKEILEMSYMANVMMSNGNTQFPSQVKTKNFNHTHTFRADLELPGKVFLQSDVNATFNPGNSSFANSVNVVTWDAQVEKKFLANDQLVFKAKINDILNKNTGYSRILDGANWSESNGFVLRRYWMFSVTWNFGGSL